MSTPRHPVRTDSIEDVIGRMPHAARVFARRGMACVGCALSRFETVADAAANYGVNERVLLRELRSGRHDRRPRGPRRHGQRGE